MGIVRKTKSVNAILEVFSGCKTAISTTELVERFYNQMNKSTVYRVLERLEDEGTLHSFVGNDGLRWYALCNDLPVTKLDMHPHFQCKECGKTECLPVRIDIPEIAKYNVESASLLLTGKCENCTASS